MSEAIFAYWENQAVAREKWILLKNLFRQKILAKLFF